MRINQYLASCGLASRRSAEKLVRDGRVTINGIRITDLSTRVGDKDDVRVDGKSIHLATKKIYVLLNKPKDYVTTVQDERQRRTVMDLIDLQERVFPVGRLDAKSTGLLLLTNDGDLAYRLTHPRFKLAKVYRVSLTADFAERDLTAMESGLQLEDGPTQPCRVRYFRETADHVEVRMHEGRNHQVRRMFAVLGYDVKSLQRVRFGPLELKGLERGKWRHLRADEISDLKVAVGLETRSKGRTKRQKPTGK
jgi:23S rRNA pseudouridine2605 synthase